MIQPAAGYRRRAKSPPVLGRFTPPKKKTELRRRASAGRAPGAFCPDQPTPPGRQPEKGERK